jgi:HEAT repeat protein
VTTNRPAVGFALAVALFAAPRLRAEEPRDHPEAVRQALLSRSVDQQRSALLLIPDMKLEPQQAANLAGAIEDLLWKTNDEETKALALHAYGSLGPPPGPAARVLKAHLALGSARVRRAAAEALARVASASAMLFGRPPVNAPANIEGVGIAGGSPLALAWLRGGFQTTLREDAPYNRFGETCKLLLPLCSIALRDADATARGFGADAVRALARAAADVLPEPAASGTDARPVEPVEAKLRWALVLPALEALNAHAPSLRGALESPRPETRRAGARAAGAVVQARWQALVNRNSGADDLAALLGGDPPADPLKGAVAALLPALAARLGDDAPEVRIAVAEAIENGGEFARTQLDAVAAASASRDVFERWVATRTLGRLFTGANARQIERILAALRARLTDTDLDVRRTALTALGRGGSMARPATAAVLEVVLRERADPEFRAQAVRTLQLIEAERVLVVPVLAEALSTDSARVRREVVMFLGASGNAARPVVPEIRKLLNDPEEDVRREAARALLAIEREL